MINDVDKYLKAPLGEDEKEKKKRQREEERQRKERETEEEEGVICEDRPDAPLTPFQRWEQSLMACTSINQVGLEDLVLLLFIRSSVRRLIFSKIYAQNVSIIVCDLKIWLSSIY